MTEATAIRLQVDKHRARITLDNSASHNALDTRALDDFHAVLDQLAEQTDLRVLVITGAGERTFCAGASLNQLRSGEMDPALFTSLTDRIDALELPTICALNGSVYGGGVEIALCCDFRIGVIGSRMRVPPAQIGLCYPRNGMQRYLSRLGLQTTRRLLLTSEELDADQMLALGLLDRLVPAAKLEQSVTDLASHIEGLAPLALRAMKVSLNQLASGAVDEARLDTLAGACAKSEDLKEGLAAQRERRAPRFRGR